MQKSFEKLLAGYQKFQDTYAQPNNPLMNQLATEGQKPECMVVSCCDSRVDPALILQCDPGDLFIVRNIAGIIPPYERDHNHHGTSAALEFGICYLNVKHLIILGHSQCGGIKAILETKPLEQNDFITDWVSALNLNFNGQYEVNKCVQAAVQTSKDNCLTFPWIKQRVDAEQLQIHQWFFDIESAKILAFNPETGKFAAI